MADQLKIHWATDMKQGYLANAYGYKVHSDTLRKFVSDIAIISDEAKDSIIIASSDLYKERVKDKTNWLFTMSEGTTLPKECIENLQKADYLLTPSLWARSILGKYFDETKIFVVHHGVEPCFKYVKRKYPVGKPFRFLWVGAPNERKGWPELINAWKVFERRRDVELYVKTTGLKTDYQLQGNVILDSRNLTQDEMVKLYEYAHCFVFPSRAEGFGLCVGPDTLIQVPEGVTKIKDINIGQKVLTLDGKFHVVKDKVNRRVREVLEFKIKGSPNIIVTPEHPFLAYTFPRIGGHSAIKNKSVKNALWRNEKKELVPEWIRADRLGVGDLIATPISKDIGILPSIIDITSFIKNIKYDNEFVWKKMGYSPKTKELVKIRRIIQVNDNFLHLVGLYIAEGSGFGGSGIEFSFHKDEIDLANTVKNYLSDLFEVNSTITIRDNRCELVACSTILSELFTILCGKGAKNKHVHSMFMKCPSRLYPLVKGVIDGDGHLYKHCGGCSICTISINLAWQLKSILSSIGIFSRIHKKDNSRGYASKEKYIWQIEIGGESGEILCDWTGINNRTKGNRSASRHSIITNDFILVPILNIKEKSGDFEVFDLQVDETKSFVGNGIILHNTLLEAMATGLPCIATGYSGITDFFDDEVGYPLKFVMGDQQAAYQGGLNEVTQAAFPDIVDMVNKMIYIFKNYRKALTKGKKASELAHKHFTWKRSAQSLIDIIIGVK